MYKTKSGKHRLMTRRDYRDVLYELACDNEILCKKIKDFKNKITEMWAELQDAWDSELEWKEKYVVLLQDYNVLKQKHDRAAKGEKKKKTTED